MTGSWVGLWLSDLADVLRPANSLPAEHDDVDDDRHVSRQQGRWRDMTDLERRVLELDDADEAGRLVSTCAGSCSLTIRSQGQALRGCSVRR